MVHFKERTVYANTAATDSGGLYVASSVNVPVVSTTNSIFDGNKFTRQPLVSIGVEAPEATSE